MILTCPSCDTRFFVEPSTYGPAPRKVRCSRCRHVWMQEPLPEPAPEPPPVPNVVQQAALGNQYGAAAAAKQKDEDDWVPPPPPGGKPPAPERIVAPPPPLMEEVEAPPPPRFTGFDDDIELKLGDMDRPPLHPPLDEPLSTDGLMEDPDDVLNQRRARLAEAGVQRTPPRPKKPRSWAWLGWLMLIGVVAGIVGGGYEKRVELVAFYPPLAKLYEHLGIPVDAAEWLGLELHNLKSATVLEGGQTKIAVSGEVVNVGEAERMLPPIRIVMRGAHGADLGASMIKLEQPNIAGGEKLSFDIRLNAPKDEVVDLEVAFSSQPAH